MSSSAYRPPGSKSSSAPTHPTESSRQRNRFISSRPIVEKPPDTSCDSLFPELGGTKPPGDTVNNTSVKTTAWGPMPAVVRPMPAVVRPTPTVHPAPPPPMVGKSKHPKKKPVSRSRRKIFLTFDSQCATQLMHSRKMEEEELNALSGYRNDYVYLHELDDRTYYDDDSDEGSDS